MSAPGPRQIFGDELVAHDKPPGSGIAARVRHTSSGTLFFHKQPEIASRRHLSAAEIMVTQVLGVAGEIAASIFLQKIGIKAPENYACLPRGPALPGDLETASTDISAEYRERAVYGLSPRVRAAWTANRIYAYIFADYDRHNHNTLFAGEEFALIDFSGAFGIDAHYTFQRFVDFSAQASALRAPEQAALLVHELHDSAWMGHGEPEALRDFWDPSQASDLLQKIAGLDLADFRECLQAVPDAVFGALRQSGTFPDAPEADVMREFLAHALYHRAQQAPQIFSEIENVLDNKRTILAAAEPENLVIKRLQAQLAAG